MEYLTKHVGKKFKNRDGSEFEIIKGGEKPKTCVIRFSDCFKHERVVYYENIKRSNIRNPYTRTVYNVGFIGSGKYSVAINSKHTKVYSSWFEMLRRVYCDKYTKLFPTYKKASICKCWLNFQTFGKWHEENYVDGWVLDKDLISKDKKFYSLKTCVYIPEWLNLLLSNKNSHNTTGFVGVTKCKNGRYHSHISYFLQNKSKHLGYYSTKEEAYKAYCEERIEYLRLAIKKYEKEAIEKNVNQETILKVKEQLNKIINKMEEM